MPSEAGTAGVWFFFYFFFSDWRALYLTLAQLVLLSVSLTLFFFCCLAVFHAHPPHLPGRAGCCDPGLHFPRARKLPHFFPFTRRSIITVWLGWLSCFNANHVFWVFAPTIKVTKAELRSCRDLVSSLLVFQWSISVAFAICSVLPDWLKKPTCFSETAVL